MLTSKEIQLSSEHDAPNNNTCGDLSPGCTFQNVFTDLISSDSQKLHKVVGGGITNTSLQMKKPQLREFVSYRDYKWQK